MEAPGKRLKAAYSRYGPRVSIRSFYLELFIVKSEAVEYDSRAAGPLLGTTGKLGPSKQHGPYIVPLPRTGLCRVHQY
jgi:hypothetical protein